MLRNDSHNPFILKLMEKTYVVVESMIMIGVNEMCVCVCARAIGNLSREDDSGYLGI